MIFAEWFPTCGFVGWDIDDANLVVSLFVTAVVLGLVEWDGDDVSLSEVGDCVKDGRCVWVVTAAAVLELRRRTQCLSSLALQCLPVAFKPCLIHSSCSSSFPSKQQYEHCWQICGTFLEKKYPFSQVPLQIRLENLVHWAATISSTTHCWQLWQGAESSSPENVSLGQGLQPILLGGCVIVCPHTGCNP